MAKAATKKRAKQGHLNGMEPETIREVEDAADVYYEHKNTRIAASKEEKATKINLIEVMLKNKLTSYTTADGLIVNFLSKSEVTCRKRDESNADIDEEE